MSSAGGEDPSVVVPTAPVDPATQAAQMAAAAQAMGALFGLPRYSGTNAIGQPYSNQLKPGADFMAKRTAQAAENERVTNAFKAKQYMPNWAVQQPAAQWTGARPNPASYFPGIRNVSGGTPGSGTNLGFGTIFGALAPSGMAPGGGAPNVLPNTAQNGGTVAPPGTPRNPWTTPGYTNATGNGGETRVPIETGTGRAPTQTGAPNQAEFLLPSQTVTGGTTVAQATGQNVRRTVTLPDGTRQWVNEVVPVDPKWAGYYIPPQYVGHALPGGAFTSLFPNSDGTGWVKTPPPDWGPNWRPAAAPRQLGG